VSDESIFTLPRPSVVQAIVRRDFRITRSYRLAFVLEAVYGLFQLAVYFFISRSFVTVSSAELHGAPSYFAFAAVGAILGAVVGATGSEIGSRLREEQLTGTFEALGLQPLTSGELCVGLISFPFLYSLARATVYLVIAGFWMHLDASRASWLGLILVLIAAGLAFAPLGIISAALVLLFKRGQIVAALVLLGMTLVGGSVFPISSLPNWLEPIGHVVPIRFAFDGARSALFRGGGWGIDVIALAGFSLALWPLALGLFAWALRRARHAGTLSQY